MLGPFVKSCDYFSVSNSVTLTDQSLSSDTASHFTTLALTSIEKFHVLSRTVAYPNVLICRFWVDRIFDRPIFEKAVELAYQRHGILNRRLHASDGRLDWVTRPDSNVAPVSWSQGTGPISDDTITLEPDWQKKLDLSNTAGAHVWCRVLDTVDSPRTRVVCCCDHAVCDGLGGAQYISDLLIVYDNLYAQRDWNDGLRKLTPIRMKQRNRLGINRWAWWKHAWKQPIAWLGLCAFFFHRFNVITGKPIKSNDSSAGANSEATLNSSPQKTLGLTGRWLSQELSEAIDSLAANRSVSANALVMHSVFDGLRNWMNETGRPPLRKWFRMVLPISIRSKDDLRLPMTNRASIVQIDRSEKQINSREFLYYLDREIKIILDWQFDKLFLMIIRIASVSGRWLKRLAQSTKPRATIVFTNLGRPFRAMAKRTRKVEKKTQPHPRAQKMSTEILEFDFAGPLQHSMPLNFSIQRYQQRYRISLRFDGDKITTDEARAFLSMIEDRLNAMTS